MVEDRDSGADIADLTVVAGAVARGAYETAALTAVLDGIGADLRSTIFLGTSSGSISSSRRGRTREPRSHAAGATERPRASGSAFYWAVTLAQGKSMLPEPPPVSTRSCACCTFPSIMPAVCQALK